MELKKRLVISFMFINGEAERVKKFYDTNDYTHSEIYQAGIKSLEKKRKNEIDKL